MSLARGAQIGPYEVVMPLGAGGMGEVYRARDPRLGRDVAVKVISSALEVTAGRLRRRVGRDVAVKVFSSALEVTAERLRRFEDEARAAGALKHPNILAVFDVGSY